MDKKALIERLESVLQDARKQLNENEHSTMDSIASSVKVGYESLKASVSGSDSVKFGIEKFKEHLDVFEKALKDGDRATAVRTLEAMQSTIDNLRTLGTI